MTETLNMRIDAERKRLIQAAATLENESLTSFVLAAAEIRAVEIMDAQRVTEVPTEFFDDFFHSLSNEPTDKLVEAARRHRKIVKRA